MEWMRPNVAMREAEKANYRAVIVPAKIDVNFRIVDYSVLFAGRYARAEEMSPTASTRTAV